MQATTAAMTPTTTCLCPATWVHLWICWNQRHFGPHHSLRQAAAVMVEPGLAGAEEEEEEEEEVKEEEQVVGATVAAEQGEVAPRRRAGAALR